MVKYIRGALLSRFSSPRSGWQLPVPNLHTFDIHACHVWYPRNRCSSKWLWHGISKFLLFSSLSLLFHIANISLCTKRVSNTRGKIAWNLNRYATSCAKIGSTITKIKSDVFPIRNLSFFFPYLFYSSTFIPEIYAQRKSTLPITCWR